MAKDKMKISPVSCPSPAKSPSAIGGEKESTMKTRNINTSVNLYSRSSDKFSTEAKKKGHGISTKGGK